MSESSQRRFLSKRQKIQCTKCNETFDSDHEKRHMERNHPLLVKEGKTPSTIPVVEKSQSNLLSFFQAAPQKTDQASSSTKDITDSEEQDIDEQSDKGTSFEPADLAELEHCASPAYGHKQSETVTRDNELEATSEKALCDPIETNSNEESDASMQDQSANHNISISDELNDIDSDISDDSDDNLHEDINFNDCINVPTVERGPNQPNLPSYPTKNISGVPRSFKNEWYAKHSWLEYDVEKDEASCFSCKNFGKTGSQEFQFSRWSDLRRLSKHEKSHQHQWSMVAWISSKAKSRSSEPLTQIEDKHKKEVQQNRLYLQKIIESLTFIAKQNIPLRTTEENRANIASSSDANRGNFLELISLRCRDIPWLQDQLDSMLKRHHQWTAPRIQNEILSIVSKFVLDHIINQVKAVGPFSIIADETSDISNLEQVSLYLRFVQDAEIHEKFIGFMETASTTGQSLFDLIKNTLQLHTLDLNNLVGQGYDGASNMSSARVGVSGRMQNEAPRAIYIHCYGHQLNLSAQKSMTQVPSFRNCLGTVQEIYNFIEASPKRHALFKETQKQRSEKELTLKSQSKTRWACRKAATSALKQRLPATLQTLLHVDESDPKLTSKCNGLISNMLTYEFIFSLLVVDEVLGLIDGLSQFLQSEKMDVFAAKNSALSVIQTLKKLLDQGFESTWEKASEIAVTMKQVISSHHFLDFKEAALPRNASISTAKEYYKSTLHGDGITHAISELETRFDKDHQEVICALTKVVMAPSFEVSHEANVVSEFYALDKSSLLSDRKIVATAISLHQKEDVLTATYKLIKWMHDDGIRDILPSFKAAANILASIPATSCSAERSFSALRRIKTYLRNRLGDEQLSAVAILNIERETTNCIEANRMAEIIDEFARQNDIRKQLLLHNA